MKTMVILIMMAALLLGGCSGMSNSEQRVLSGTAIGAGGGTLIGWAAGGPLLGAVVGAGAGAVGGVLYDQHQKSRGKP